MTLPDRTGQLVHVVHAINFFEVTADFGRHFYPSGNGMQNLFCGALATVNVNGVTGLYAGTGNDIRATSSGYVENGYQQWGLKCDVGGAIFELTSDAANPSRIFAGTEGFGVLRSTNYGNAWSNSSTGMVPLKVTDIDQSRAAKGTLYAATDAGIFVSYTGGQKWESRAQDQNPLPIVGVHADPVYPGWVYYATADGRVFRSQDEGLHFLPLWSCPTGDSIRQIERAPFFELFAVLASGKLYASTDDGLNFFPRGQDSISERILCVASNETRPWIVYVGTEFGGVYRSGTSGDTWEKRTQGIKPAIVYSIAVAPDNDSFIAAGTRGAVYTSPDEGVTWTRSRSGIPSTCVVSRVMFDPNNPDRMFARVEIEPTEASTRPSTSTQPQLRGLNAAPGGNAGAASDLGVQPVKTFAGQATPGMYVSQDRGRTWRLLTNSPDYRQMNTLCISRTEPGTLFAGANLVGVGRSTDGGATWSPSSDGMTLIVLSIAVNPADPSIVYAATFSSGVFKSTDGGQHWSSVGPPRVTIFHVAIDPTVPDTVYASTSQGVMRTDDAGGSWRLAGQDTPFIISMAADPAIAGRVYIGSYTGKVYRSDDGGKSWLDISNSLPADDINGVAVSARDGTVYALTAAKGLYRSHDAGQTWWPASADNLGGYRAINIAIDQITDDVYVGVWGGALRSSNHGTTWTPLPLNFNQDYPSSISLVQLPGGNLVVFVSVLNATGPGAHPEAPVLRSLDRGNTWTKLTAGISSTDANWVTSSGGLLPKIYLAAEDGVYRSDNLGQEWSPASAGLDGLHVYSLGVDSGDPNRVYAATSAGLYVTSNAGAQWAPMNFDTAGIGAAPLWVATAEPGRVYLGTSERGVFYTSNQGVNWSGGVTPEAAVMASQALAVNPLDRNTLWVATGDQGVFVSRDRGETWTKGGHGMSAQVMFTITIDPEQPSTIYATSQDAGVWVSVNDGQDWAPLNDGLTNPFVTAFAIDVNNHKLLYAGTEGGGVFRLLRP